MSIWEKAEGAAKRDKFGYDLSDAINKIVEIRNSNKLTPYPFTAVEADRLNEHCARFRAGPKSVYPRIPISAQLYT